MKTLQIAILLFFAVHVLPGLAATNDLTTMLQKALFEEEANHNIPAAIQAYEALITSFDADRKLAATAVFRLGECYRKQGRTNDAVAQYERVVREFADQPNLIQLSRQNLATIRPDAPALASTPAREEQVRLLQAEIALVEKQLEEEQKRFENGISSRGDLVRIERELLGLKRQLAAAREGSLLVDVASDPNQVLRSKLNRLLQLKPDELRIAVQQEFPNPVLDSLLQKLNEAEVRLAELRPDYGPEHNLVLKQQQVIKTLDSQINAQVQGLIGGLRAKLSEAQGGLAASDEPASPEDTELARIRKLIQDSPDLINAPQPNGETLLDTAAAQGNLAVAKLLLDSGAAVNGVKQPGLTPLHYAAANARNSMVETLLSSGAKPNVQTVTGVTPLHLAAHKGYETVAKTLLEAGAPVNSRTEGPFVSPLVKGPIQAGQTPLHAAAASGYITIVKLLLSKSAEVNHVDAQGRTALSYAVQNRNEEMTEALLQAKADPDAGTSDRSVALAAATGQVGIMKKLLVAGGNPDRASIMSSIGLEPILRNREHSPLSLAVTRKHLDAVRELLNHKADPNGTAWDGQPVVSHAAASSEVLELLLKAGADPNRTGQGESPLLHAVRSLSTNSVELLLAHGADPNIARTDGLTPLHEVSWRNSHVIAEMLLKHRANPALKFQGQTPLHMAVKAGAAEAVDVLLSNGADPNAFDDPYTPGAPGMAGRAGGKTPLDYAKEMARSTGPQPANVTRADFERIEKLLRKHGALDEVPRMDRIQVRRPGDPSISWAVQISTNTWTHLTVWEVLCMYYGILSDEPRGEGRRTELLVDMRNRMLAFPNLAAVTIRRPGADWKSWSPSTVDISPVMRSGDCSKDVRVEVGDLIEVSELDHPINQPWGFFSEAELQNIFKCLARTINITVKGETSQLKLQPTINRTGLPTAAISLNEPFWLRPVLQNSRLVLASSDLSRVKLSRTDKLTGQKFEAVFDCTGNTPAPEVWLLDGDLIEIPERQ